MRQEQCYYAYEFDWSSAQEFRGLTPYKPTARIITPLDFNWCQTVTDCSDEMSWLQKSVVSK